MRWLEQNGGKPGNALVEGAVQPDHVTRDSKGPCGSGVIAGTKGLRQTSHEEDKLLWLTGVSPRPAGAAASGAEVRQHHDGQV